MRLVKSSSAQDDKPWLVLQENFSSLPNNTFISGTIECAGMRSFIGIKYGNYGCFIVDHYSTSVPIYRVVNMNGTWKYSAVQTGEWTTV